MRLISNFSDYYDGLFAYDEDRQTIFNRTKEYIPLKDLITLFGTNKNNQNISSIGNSQRINEIYTNFTNGIYNYFVVVINNKIYLGVKPIDRDIVMYDVNKELFIHTITNSHRIYFNPKHIESVLKQLQECVNSIKIDCPYYLMGLKMGYGWIKSTFTVIGILKYPTLKNYDIQKLIDPYTIFQEIDMWFNSNGSIEKEVTSTGTDEQLAEAKGFDRKFSFRKPKKKP